MFSSAKVGSGVIIADAHCVGGPWLSSNAARKKQAASLTLTICEGTPAILTSRDLQFAEVAMWARISGFGFAALAACWASPVAQAGQFEFLAAPQINLSLVYRLDKLSGDVIACQFAHNPGRPDVGPGAFGVTSCYRSGEGATKQDPGDYGLIATRHEQEGGVFRVDNRTGALSICYLYFQREKQGDHEAIADQYVVCTPPWKQATAAPARSSGAVSELPAAGPTRD
jgi:hypothetical protein